MMTSKATTNSINQLPSMKSNLLHQSKHLLRLQVEHHLFKNLS